MEGQKALRFLKKHVNLCSGDERKSYGFETTLGEELMTKSSFLGELSL